MKILENKVAIVTGGTSGIGAATSKIFAKNGAKVAIIGRNEELGMKVEKEILDSGDEAKFIKCDISNENEIEFMISEVIKIYGDVDILFNNAGTMLPSVEIERLPYSEWRDTFAVNLDGYFFVTRNVRKIFLKNNKGGVILNNASIAGMQHYAAGRSYAYSASKAAVIQFSHMMAKNYAEEGIRVNCICPGIIETPILHGRDPKLYEDRIPLKRVGTPEDVAKVALFLVSDDAAYLTGVVLPVDGGASI